MGSKPSLVIAPIDFDAATRAVDTFSQKRNIPSMIFPENAAKREGAAAPEPSVQPAVIALPPSRRVQRIPVELPQYVVDDIKRRALDGRCSARHVVMRALRAYGVHISEEDMVEDGRRLR